MVKKSILLSFISLVILSLSCSISYDLDRSPDREIIVVEASEGWTDTNIVVGPGDLLSIRYLSGMWSPWPGGEYDAIGSGGDPRCRCNEMDAVSHAALIGRIGETQPFLVAMRYEHVVGEAGNLFLGINDVDLYDNSGFIEVVVKIVRK